MGERVGGVAADTSPHFHSRGRCKNRTVKISDPRATEMCQKD